MNAESRESLKTINAWLKDNFGAELDGTARFRLVLSDEKYTEKRKGEFEIFQGPIFLRTHKGVMEVPKYPWLKNQYVVERWIPSDGILDLLGTKGSYCPLYAFPNVDGRPLKPPMRALRFLIHTLLYGPKKTAADHQRDEIEEEKRDYEENLAILDEASPYLASQLHEGSAIVNKAGKELFKP